MAMTAAQRQAQYRARREFGGSDGNGERRLNVWIDARIDLALTRLARRYCVTKREMIERLVAVEDDSIIKGMHLDSPDWDAYFGVAPLRSNGEKID